MTDDQINGVAREYQWYVLLRLIFAANLLAIVAVYHSPETLFALCLIFLLWGLWILVEGYFKPQAKTDPSPIHLEFLRFSTPRWGRWLSLAILFVLIPLCWVYISYNGPEGSGVPLFFLMAILSMPTTFNARRVLRRVFFTDEGIHQSFAEIPTTYRWNQITRYKTRDDTLILWTAKESYIHIKIPKISQMPRVVEIMDQHLPAATA